MFHTATGETTAVPNEETTAVPPGKTTNNIEQEKKGLLNSNHVFGISSSRLNFLVVGYEMFS